MEKPALNLVKPESPSFKNGTIQKTPKTMPNRKANDRLRGRQHLSEAEVARLKETALRVKHYGFRDATMVMTAFRHGLRCAELVDLTWDQVDFDAGKLHVRRVKNSSPSTHMLQGDELRAFRRLKREQRPPSPFAFTSERGHGTGFKLANDGVDTRAIQDYLGHKSITNTVRYSRLSPERFKSFRWRD
jgi:integrase